MNKKIIFTLITLVIVGAAAFLVFALSQNKESTEPQQSPDTEVNVESDQERDKDTNEPLDKRYVDFLENMDGSREYNTRTFGIIELSTILGSKINEVAAVGEYRSALILDISTALAIYGDVELEKEYETLTVIPDSIAVEGNSKITANVRLGQSDKIVPLSVQILTTPFKSFIPGQTVRHGYVTINQGESAFRYLGGLEPSVFNSYSTTQTNFSQPTVMIRSDKREDALKYLKDIGYKIPDLTISFGNYRSLFE